MREADFLFKWHAERDFYRAWGQFVQEEIERDLLKVESDLKLDVFLKIKSSRIKNDEALLGKAFHHGKAYASPYLDIEDKVGVRFVVLLTADIRKLQGVIKASNVWTASLDRDFEAERDLRPLEFVYQSKHYVVKAARETKVGTKGGEITVPAGTPCEVQLRTLLQHAHSELTHDNIYKREPGSTVTKRVERAVAKSMALIEAVDDYFVEALRELEAATEDERAALNVLTVLYTAHIGQAPHTDKSSALVLHAFKSNLGADFQARLEHFLKTHPFVIERIQTQMMTHYIFRQPWILLAYLMVNAEPIVTARRWPLTSDEIRPIYTDLGKSFPRG